MQRWAAEKQSAGIHQMASDEGVRRLGEIEGLHVDALGRSAVGDLARENVSGSPHRRVCNDQLVFRLACREAIVDVEERPELCRAAR